MKNRAFRKFVASIGVAAMVMSTATNALSPAVTKAESAQELEGQQNDSQEQGGQEDPVAQSSDDANGAPFADAEPMAVSSENSQDSQEAAGPLESSDSNGENGAEGSSGENTNTSAGSTSTDASGAESQGTAGTISGATNGTAGTMSGATNGAAGTTNSTIPGTAGNAGTMSGATNGTCANGTSANTSTDAANGTSANASTGTTTGENGEASGDNAEASTKEITSVITEDIDLGTYPAGEAPAYAQLELPDEIEVKVDEEKQIVTVTWNGEETYHPDQAGTYIFSSELDKEWNKDENGNARYQLAEKVELPKASVRVEKKAESKEENKTDVKSDNKTENKTDAKLDNKTDSKTDAKSDNKKDSKTDAKADNKSEGKTEEKSDSKSEVTTKPETTKDTSKENTKETSKKDSTSKDKTKDEAKGETKDKTKDETKAETKTDTKDESAKADQKKKVTNAASLKAVYVAEDGTILCGTVGLTGDSFTISDKAKSFNGYELKTVTLGEEELPQDTAFTRNTSTTETKKEIRTEASYTYTMDGAEHEIAAGDTATITFTYAQKEEVTPEIASIEVTGEAVDTTGAAIQGDYAFPLAVGTNDLSKTAPYIQGYEYQYAEIGTDKITSIDKEVLEAGKYAYYVDGELLKENTRITYVYQEDEDYTKLLTGTCGNLTVTVSAKKDAKIPEGTIVRVSPIESARMSQIMAKISETLGQDPDNVIGVLYDISLDKDGEEIQPKESVHVTMKFDGGIPWNVPEGKQIADTKVVHMHGGETDVVAEAAEDGNAEFETESFSTYIVAARVAGASLASEGESIDLSTALRSVSISKVVINGKEEEFDSNKQYPRDAKFIFALDYSFADNNKPVAGGVTKATYTLPAELNVSNGSGSIEAKGYAGEAGTYTISNGVITFVYNTDFLSKHPTAIEGGFSFEGSVNEKSTTNKEKVDILFPGEGEGEKITIKFEDGKVSGSKSYQFNEDGTITFTVDLNVTGKDVTNVVLSDILGDNLDFANPPEFKLDKNDILDSKITGEGNKREVVLGDLPVGNHKVTYKVNVVDKNNTKSTKNTAKCTWKGGESPDISTEVSFVQKNLSKQGFADKSKNEITWTVIYVPGQYTAAAGKKCTDTIGEGQKYSGKCDVYYDPNGTQWYVSASDSNRIDSIPLDADKNSFEYTFPDKCTALGGAYKLVYHTETTDNLSELVSPKDYTNEVHVDGKDLTSEWKVSVAPDQAPSLNSSKTGEILNEDERIVKWTVTATPPDGKNMTALTIKDELLENEKAKGEYINDSLVIKKGENNKLIPGTDYTVTTPTGQEGELLITFLRNDISEKITVSYNVKYSASKDDQASSVTNKATITYTIDGKPGSKEEYGSVKFPEKTFSITKDGTITGNIIDWTIVVNNTDEYLWADLSKSAGTIVDTLPAGMEYVGDSAQCTIIPQYRHDSIFYPQVKVTYDSAKRTLTFAVDEINGKIQAIIKYRTKLNGTLPSESDPGVEISDNKISYTNRVKVGDNEATKTIEITQKELTKTGKQSEKSKNVVEYTLGVNYMGDDLVEGSDTVQLEDVLDQDLIIDPGTLSVKDMNTGEDVSYQVSYNTTGDGRTKVTLTLPDQRALLVVYSAQLSSAGKTDGQSYEVKNNATLKGTSEKTVSNNTLVKYEKPAATVSGKVDNITIHKMGESSNNLSGATFALSKVNPATLESESDKANCEKTTGENGLIVFDGLSMNTLYCYWEKQAPTGYQLDDTKHYFIIQNFSDNDRKKEYYDLIKSIKPNTDVASLTGGNVFTISNTKLISISGKKIWDDADNQDGKRPDSITVNLLANGEVKESKTVTAANEWKYAFTNLPKYAAGQKITYTVTENEVADYTTEIKGYDITNSYTPEKTKVSVSKSWNDDNNRDNKRPDSIEVKLVAKVDGSEIEVLSSGTQKLNGANGWKYTFTDLPKYHAGKLVEYTIEEVNIPAGYTKTITGNATDGFNITNTYTPEKVQVSGSKNWNDDGNAAGTRPGSITIRLYANGSEIDRKTVTEKDGWSWNWTGLNRYDTDHKEISYTISEDAVDGYTSSISGYNVTNTVNKPQVGSVILTKVDATTGTALAGAVFDLYRANNTKVGTYTTNAGGVLRVDGLTFGDYYFVETKAPEGYALESQRAAFTINAATTVSAPASVRVTNKPVDEKIGVSAAKVWDDENNIDGVRPSSVTFRLFADGVEIGSAQASEANGWTVSFGNLPKTKNGVAISYAVKEDEVGNYYEASYETGLGSDGSYVFTVKNYRETDKHYEERTGSVRGANRNKPSNGGVAGAGRGRGTGDESDMTVYGTVSGASLLALIVWMIARRKRAGKGTK